jgi:hypothetical protein
MSIKKKERNQENNPIYIASKNEIPRNRLIKEVKTSVIKTVQHWRKELEKTLEDGPPMFMDQQSVTVLPKAMYTFNAIHIKIPMLFFIEIEIPILKLKWDHKGPQIAKVILFKKRNTWDITLSDFGLFYN